jgi:iron complex outermembrane receptor protein
MQVKRCLCLTTALALVLASGYGLADAIYKDDVGGDLIPVHTASTRTTDMQADVTQVAQQALLGSVPTDQGTGKATAPAATDRAAKPEGSSGIEEIIVTAVRRETNLEETPISMSVLSAADISKNRVVDVNDVTRLTPGLNYIPRGSSEGYLSLRGAIIFDDSPGTDPAVSLLVDDVVRVSVADVQPELFDMDRVEVLKGPQGTLFGRNSIGGIVSMYTRQPSFRREGSAEVTYGEHNLAEVKGMLNTPIIEDKLAGRVVFSVGSVSGNVKDITTGAELNGEHKWAARGKLLFTPSDDFKFVTGFDYLLKRGTNSTWAAGNFQPVLVPGMTFDPEKTSQYTPGLDYQNNWGFTGRADWTTGIGVLTSITGYRHLNADSLTVTTAAPINIARVIALEHDTQFTQELRLASPTDQRLTWIAGLYYLHNNKDRTLEFVSSPVPGTLFADFAAFPSPIDSFTIQAAHTTSAAPFGDITYAITDRLKVDVGARYTWQEKSGHGYVNPSGTIAGGPISAHQSASWTAFTPKLTVSYEPTQGLMTYATASKGFLSGGFNAQGSTSSALARPFDSEYVWNYELGAKFLGLDNRLQVNIAGFFDRYTNLQIIETSSTTFETLTTNAGAASVDGIETDISLAPVDWLTFGVKYDFLHGRFTKYLIDNGDGTFTDDTGKKVPFTPSHQVTASAEVHTDLSNNAGRMAIGGDYSYRSSEEFTVGNNTPQFIRDLSEWRGIVNLHASWSSQDERWEVSFWGKNITNRHYAVIAQDFTSAYASFADVVANQDHIFVIQSGPYQSYGVTLRTKF